MEELMTGTATPAQFGAYVTALRMKGETVDEIAGMARVMREKAASTSTIDGPLLDTCGTGGDDSGSFNVSTCAAFVAAGAGARVAKHGNRAMTSKCGSADVLEALGAKIDLTPEQVAACIERAGIGFMFAQAFHPAMKYVAPAAPRDRHPHRVQHARPADEPRRRDAPGHRRRRAPISSRRWRRCSQRLGSRARARRPRRRWLRRGQHQRADDRVAS